MVSEKGNSGGNKDTTYILTPRFIFSRYVHGGSAWDEARFTVCLEWRLVAADGKLKWVDTIKGIGKGSGFLKTTKLDNSMKLAIQDTFDKSQSAMLASRVLRELTQAP